MIFSGAVLVEDCAQEECGITDKMAALPTL
jgi:hypothetical protein